jgi:class 3 adenylate cyclase
MLFAMTDLDIRYAKSGDLYIAYQTVGEGKLDLVIVPGFVWHLEHQWEWPEFAAMLRRLASFSRLIIFDKRGTGLSDRVPPAEMPTLEQRMDDLRAVLDACGSERASLLGFWEGGPMCALFAATYPQRTRALVLYGAPAAFTKAPGYPWAPDAEANANIMQAFGDTWGQGRLRIMVAPSVTDDERIARWYARLERLGASPGAAIALWRMNCEIDVRHVLPSVRVPTLVLHRRDDTSLPVEVGRYVAQQVPGARFVELEGRDHLPWVGNMEPFLGEIEEFLTGTRGAAEVDRVLATVLFTDIVESTERARELGDRSWRDLLERFQDRVRDAVGRFRGREIDTAGDGLFATFDGPARAIRCAQSIRDALRALGLAVRTGVHTGECEVSGDKVAGIAVHMGARVAASASPGEILVSSTVKDLVAGSGLRFEDRGVRVLKGMPGEWHLYAVAG